MRPVPSAIIARATYLVSTIGDRVLRRTSSSILPSCHQRQRSIVSERRIVDEAEQGAEFLAHAAHQMGNLVDSAEVERFEMKRSLVLALGSGYRCRHLLALVPRHR